MAEVSDNFSLSERQSLFCSKITEIKFKSQSFALLSRDEIQNKIEEIENLKTKSGRCENEIRSFHQFNYLKISH